MQMYENILRMINLHVVAMMGGWSNGVSVSLRPGAGVELTNEYNCFAVAVLKDGEVVGHVL